MASAFINATGPGDDHSNLHVSLHSTNHSLNFTGTLHLLIGIARRPLPRSGLPLSGLGCYLEDIPRA